MKLPISSGNTDSQKLALPRVTKNNTTMTTLERRACIECDLIEESPKLSDIEAKTISSLSSEERDYLSEFLLKTMVSTNPKDKVVLCYSPLKSINKSLPSFWQISLTACGIKPMIGWQGEFYATIWSGKVIVKGKHCNFSSKQIKEVVYEILSHNLSSTNFMLETKYWEKENYCVLENKELFKSEFVKIEEAEKSDQIVCRPFVKIQ